MPMDRLNALLAAGVPYSVARGILTNPSVGEGEWQPSDWPFPYRGSEEEARSQPNPEDFANWEIEQQQKTHPVRRGYQETGYRPGGALSPQMWQALQYYLGGGGQQGDALLQLVGQLYGFGNDQSNYQRSTPTPPWPQNAPYPWDMYSGQRGGPPVDFSYPPARPMLPANNALLSQNPPSYG